METNNKINTFTQVEKKYGLIQNHLDDNSSFDGVMFETYGDEVKFVQSMIEENRVITLAEYDGEMCIVNGFHFVDRIGYFVTEKSITEEFCIPVDNFDPEDEQD